MKNFAMQMRKGFTLLELMITITIIAILMSISFPAFNSAVTSAQMTKAMVNVRSIHQALTNYAADEEGAFPRRDDDLEEFTTSTEAFRYLITETGMNSEEIFWTKSNNPEKMDQPNGDGYLEDDGSETSYIYVTGLSSTAPASAPILADEMQGTDGSYGEFHPWLSKKKALVGFVGGSVKAMKLDSREPGAVIKGGPGTDIDNIFTAGTRDDEGRLTGGMLPEYIEPSSAILLPQ